MHRKTMMVSCEISVDQKGNIGKILDLLTQKYTYAQIDMQAEKIQVNFADDEAFHKSGKFLMDLSAIGDCECSISTKVA